MKCGFVVVVVDPLDQAHHVAGAALDVVLGSGSAVPEHFSPPWRFMLPFLLGLLPCSRVLQFLVRLLFADTQQERP